jgi:cytochrome c-type biogenesis protein CcmE
VTRKRRRLVLLLACGVGLGSATALALTAFQSSVEFFVSPSELAAGKESPGRTLRLGGLVEAGSLQHSAPDGHPLVHFRLTDGKAAVEVSYSGALPDLFREGQGIVAIGSVLPDGTFRADEVLAKHDENYMPKEVVEALKKSGRWNPANGAPPAASTWDALKVKSAGG